jgi:hypothetical protein
LCSTDERDPQGPHALGYRCLGAGNTPLTLGVAGLLCALRVAYVLQNHLQVSCPSPASRLGSAIKNSGKKSRDFRNFCLKFKQV